MEQIKELRVQEGCKALQIPKGARLHVVSVTPYGAAFSHQVKLVIDYCGRLVTLWARHPNRLQDPTFNLNNGNPLHKIKVSS